MKNKLFKILSVLLTYPEDYITDNLSEIESIVNECKNGNETAVENIFKTMEFYKNHNVDEIQAKYVETFDYSKRHSLNIFEHVHGVSKQRGQAMADLIDVYKKHGMELDVREMPDYIPIFFEFISILDDTERDYYLSQMIEVVSILEHNLGKSDSPWSHIMSACLSLTDVKPEHTADNIVQYENMKSLDEAYDEPAAFDNSALASCGTCDISAQCSTKTKTHSMEA